MKAKLSYSSDSRLLVIHLPSAVHEFAAEKLGRFIGDELVANNLDEQVAEYATTSYHRRDGVPSRRQPDKSWLRKRNRSSAAGFDETGTACICLYAPP